MSNENHVINDIYGIDRAFSLDKSAEIWGVKLSTVRKYVQTGRIPSIKIGSRRLVLASTISRILKEGLPQSES